MKSGKQKRIIRKQLDNTLNQFRVLLNITPPAKGWIRAIRNSLGITAAQLGVKIGIAQQAVARIEHDELHGSVTMKTMRRLAESLDCTFVYGFVPNSTLEATVRRQAAKLAGERLERASHSMSLETQALSPEDNEEMFSEMVESLIDESPKQLWDS